jgi:hypothetical protein
MTQQSSDKASVEDVITHQDSQKMLELIKKYNVTSPEQLEAIFLTPALTLDNVLAFLKKATPSELAYLFYEAALVKVSETLTKETPNADNT